MNSLEFAQYTMNFELIPYNPEWIDSTSGYPDGVNSDIGVYQKPAGIYRTILKGDRKALIFVTSDSKAFAIFQYNSIASAAPLYPARANWCRMEQSLIKHFLKLGEVEIKRLLHEGSAAVNRALDTLWVEHEAF